jgi:uncharacterized membrane protein required for colicin V production
LYCAVTGIDWAILAISGLLALWGWRQGLIVGLFSLAGFVAGALLGARIGPALLAEGSESPYAPLTALAGALAIGGIAAIFLEGFAHTLRRRVVHGRAAATLDAIGGAVLLAALGLAFAWLFGVAALNTPGAKDLRHTVQRSVVLRELNAAFPPSGDLLNALNRIDPGVAITGPDPGVSAPDSGVVADPEVRAASSSVVRVLGTACGLGVSGSGWVAAPGIVVTNAHVVAGEDDTAVAFSDGARLDADPVAFDTLNDLALLRVDGLDAPPLPIAEAPARGEQGAVVGFPENGPLAFSAARLGTTAFANSEDSYGRGPVRRELTALRGEVRSGNSGGPVIDTGGNVLTTVFASTISRVPGGYGIPNAIVERALADAAGPVDTGACTG